MDLKTFEHLLKTAGLGADESWNDDDSDAPETPWGPAQVAYDIAPGVVWYSTAGHGGLGIDTSTARKELSRPAQKEGDFDMGMLWYEEDSLWRIPFYEHPEWQNKLVRKAGGKVYTQEDLLEAIQRDFPKYASWAAENL